MKRQTILLLFREGGKEREAHCGSRVFDCSLVTKTQRLVEFSMKWAAPNVGSG